jgi:hypothetical protein
MKNPARRTAQITLSALLAAALFGCGNKCDELRDTCSKCTDSHVRDLCIADWASLSGGTEGGLVGGIVDHEACSIGIDMYQECR